jgi:hypothetical protein
MNDLESGGDGATMDHLNVVRVLDSHADEAIARCGE